MGTNQISAPWKPVSERVFSTTEIRFYVNHSLLGMSKKI